MTNILRRNHHRLGRGRTDRRGGTRTGGQEGAGARTTRQARRVDAFVHAERLEAAQCRQSRRGGRDRFGHRRGQGRAQLSHTRYSHPTRREPDVFAIGRRSRVSAWPENLRRKMERGEVAREDEEREV